jgi:hypothetical protein
MHAYPKKAWKRLILNNKSQKTDQINPKYKNGVRQLRL